MNARSIAPILLIASLASAWADAPERWFAVTIFQGTTKRAGPFPSLEACETGRILEHDRLLAASRRMLDVNTLDLNAMPRRNPAAVTVSTRPSDTRPSPAITAQTMAALAESFQSDAICDRH